MKLNATVTINLCIKLSSRALNLFLYPFWSKASFLQVSHQPGIIRMGQWCHPTGSENLFMPFQPSGTHPDVFQLSASVNEAVTMWKYAWVSCYDAFIWRQFGSSCLQLATWSLSALFQNFRKLCLWIPTFPVIWFPHLILEVKGGMNIIHIIKIHFIAHSISNINHMVKFQVLFLGGCKFNIIVHIFLIEAAFNTLAGDAENGFSSTSGRHLGKVKIRQGCQTQFQWGPHQGCV